MVVGHDLHYNMITNGDSEQAAEESPDKIDAVST